MADFQRNEGVIPHKSTISLLREIFSEHRFTSLITATLGGLLLVSLAAKGYFLTSDPDSYDTECAIRERANQAIASVMLPSDSSITTAENLSISHSVKHYLRDLDSAGLVAGFLGIGVGIYIALVMKKQDSKQQQILYQGFEDGMDKISHKVEDILSQSRKLKSSASFRELLEQINSILDGARNQECKLHIANHTAAFGYFLCYELDVVLELGGFSKDKLSQLNCVEYHNLHKKAIDLQHSKVTVPLLNAAADLKSQLTYATLRTTSGTKHTPFFDFYLEKTLSDKLVITYDPNSNLSVKERIEQFAGSFEGRTVYMVPKSIVDGKNVDEARASFTDYLLKDQINKINALETRHVNVIQLPEINLQLYVGKYGNSSAVSSKSLFLFVNQQTIGKTKGLTAFSSEDDKIADTLEAIFRDTVPKNGSTGELLAEKLFRDLNIASTDLAAGIRDLSEQLASHQIYASLNSIDRIREYMKHQVWCVWDFMSLLKSIQAQVVPTNISWTPPIHPSLGRYLYDVLRTEETDLTNEPGKEHGSHFESYIGAMKEAGADVGPISNFVESLKGGASPDVAMREAKTPLISRRFVENTLKYARGEVHKAVAVFCLSREGIIPEMFSTFTKKLPADDRLTKFQWYLDRHIELDSESHGPLSLKLFKTMVGRDEKKLNDALLSALDALNARKLLLDEILKEVSTLP